MHDLRRQALESHKTVSKKAQSRQSSRNTSRPTSEQGSKPGSRNHSRPPSDDEDNGQLSDDTAYSINSVDEFLASDEFAEAAPDVLKTELADRIDELLARKGSTNKGREDCIATYIRILTAHLCADVLYGRVTDIIASLGKSVKAETSEKETILALKAISLTAITIRDDQLYDLIAPLLKRTISDSQSLKTKAAAISCLGDCLTFGGADEDELLDQMTFFLEVVSSDGHFIDAGDDAETVIAALHVYGFLATQVRDLEAESEDAIAAFSEQLDSSHAEVQVAAGENIALLYEKAYRFPDSGEASSSSEEDSSSEADDDDDDEDEDAGPTSSPSSPAIKPRYTPFHSLPLLLQKCTALSTISTKSISRPHRKLLHQSFTAILSTLSNPSSPTLQWNNKSNMTIRIHSDGLMQINRWWKYVRLNALRRLLRGGFVNHYFEGNKSLLELLPVIISKGGGGGSGGGPRTPDRERGGGGGGYFSGGRKYKDSSFSPRSLELMNADD